jgi:hypothetical protein
MGRFGFDADGDPTVGAMGVFRIAHAKAALVETLCPATAQAKP